MADLSNPFDLVKATDLSDQQIESYFVDFPHGESLIARIKPTSPMPMIIFGGKGSGKTHLMRYLSYPLQTCRHGIGEPTRSGIAKEGYIGIYFRCGGLNAQRFSKKGQTEEAWQAAFAYYMELWLGQLLLRTVLDLFSDAPEQLAKGPLIVEAASLLDVEPPTAPGTLLELLNHLKDLQRKADIVVNNCALTRRLELDIQATPGRLTFGLPVVLARHIPTLDSILFLYLVDEFENLTEAQQQYVNTLIRERQPPTTLKVGVRLYGLRTKRTLSAEEENRENSEFDALRLDSELRERPEEAQRGFATNMVRKRLVEAGYLSTRDADAFEPSKFFEGASHDDILLEIETRIREHYLAKERPYFATLIRNLQFGLRVNVIPSPLNESHIREIVELLRFPEHPLVERTSIFLLYRAWAKKRPLIEAANHIGADARKYVAGKGPNEHQEILRYFKADIVAQMLRETRRLKGGYAGFDTFVRMSAGLPRGLLTILKHIFTWSSFYGEKPFRHGLISLNAQADGVSQASEWFFTEARAPGDIGIRVRDAMTRLGQLLREIRFSDKPSESSLSTFSAEVTKASSEAIEVLEAAHDWSMLVRIAGGGHDRNQGRVDDKYQVHPMLAPRWDLPIARRGTIGLSGEEVTAIFAPTSDLEFQRTLERRVAPMMAPYFGREIQEEGSKSLF